MLIARRSGLMRHRCMDSW